MQEGFDVCLTPWVVALTPPRTILETLLHVDYDKGRSIIDTGDDRVLQWRVHSPIMLPIVRLFASVSRTLIATLWMATCGAANAELGTAEKKEE